MGADMSEEILTTKGTKTKDIIFTKHAQIRTNQRSKLDFTNATARIAQAIRHKEWFRDGTTSSEYYVRWGKRSFIYFIDKDFYIIVKTIVDVESKNLGKYLYKHKRYNPITNEARDELLKPLL